MLKKSDLPKVSRAPFITVLVSRLLSIAKDSPPLDPTQAKSDTYQSPHADSTSVEVNPVFSVKAATQHAHVCVRWSAACLVLETSERGRTLVR